MKLKFYPGLFIFYIAVVVPSAFGAAEADPFANPPTPAFEGQTAASAPAISSTYRVEVIASGLDRPRSLVALPDGNLLVADGKGALRIVSPESGMSDPLPGMPSVRSVGGRGLMDISPAHDFEQSRVIFMAFPAPAPGQPGGEMSAESRTQAAQNGEVFQVNKIARARLSNDNSRIEDVEMIADLPGRRLLQGSDGTVYISTMGAGDLTAVQKLDTVEGKMLRINADGSIPVDNPFYGRSSVRQEIYSWGHRDPDGAMIHPVSGELWTIEHGPMGGDELNRIIPGGNFGWPNVTYGKNYDGSEIGPSARTAIEQPLYYWFPSVAVSGLMMYTGDLFPQWQGDIFIGTMSPSQGKFLLRLEMDGERVLAEEHLLVERDRRVRDIVQGADGALYVLTDSEDNADLNRHFPGEVLRLTPR
ncbi:MAG: glucose/arabinose dehydrogenase [Pseudohongiellaceae bacterium]|jgi:glucose/arabinose dehydrogenase